VVGSTPRDDAALVDVEVDVGGRACTIRLPRDEVFRVQEVFERGEYAVPEAVREWARVVVDVGANVGTFALYAKLAIRPDAVVHCFEPSPASVALLRRNVAPFDDVHVHAVALSDADGEADLHLCADNSGQHSLKRHPALHAEAVRVPVRDADAAFDAAGIDRVDVLKIDTEGSELEILRSLGPRLDRVNLVVAEYHAEEDRRAIDALLDDFCLVAAAVAAPGRGILKYARFGDPVLD